MAFFHRRAWFSGSIDYSRQHRQELFQHSGPDQHFCVAPFVSTLLFRQGLESYALLSGSLRSLVSDLFRHYVTRAGTVSLLVVGLKEMSPND